MAYPFKISIIIPNRDGGEELCQALASVFAESQPTMEVLVVDDGSTDGSPEQIRSRFPQVRLLAQPEGRGAAFARNVGLLAAQGEFLFCLDADITCSPGCLAHLLEALAQADIVFPTILFFDGQRMSPSGEFASQYCMNSALFGIRRQALERMDGLFDETIEVYGEDNDFFLRAARLGLRFAYVPQAQATHPRRTLIGERHFYLTVRNAVYVWRKLRRLVPYWMPMDLWIVLFLSSQLGAALLNAPLPLSRGGAPLHVTHRSRLALLGLFFQALLWNFNHTSLTLRQRQRFERFVTDMAVPDPGIPSSFV
jgi:GT2 family glycosyltransferase